ncbi:MAG: hypothetical protein ACI8ZH_000360 [Flavobacteriales bacterium]|mgnify:CR=1 FL=1|jgi:hypothetical protein
MKNIILLLSITLLITSCERSTSGCTEPAAINYNAYADYDNGNCTFEADVVFFYDAITANELNAAEFDRLDFYIEGNPGIYEFVDSELPTFIYGGVPNCYQATYVTTPIQWSDFNNADINYLVYGIHDLGILGEFETEVDLYSFNLGANECAAVAIRFLSKKKK